MIASFGDRATKTCTTTGRPTGCVRRFPADVVALALIKLDMLNAAAALRDLRSPPGNRLEALKGGPEGVSLDSGQRPVAAGVPMGTQ